MGYRCEACGNKTRFDFFEMKKVRAFHHLTLGGEDKIEEEEILEHEIEKIVCRWCGSTEVVEDPIAAASEGST
jgi:transposase